MNQRHFRWENAIAVATLLGEVNSSLLQSSVWCATFAEHIAISVTNLKAIFIFLKENTNLLAFKKAIKYKIPYAVYALLRFKKKNTNSQVQKPTGVCVFRCR